MIDFDDVHRRYWRDHRGDPDAAIPVRGGDFVMRGGKRYAVLYDSDRNPVAAYEVVERLFAAKDDPTRALPAPAVTAAPAFRRLSARRSGGGRSGPDVGRRE
jgi:hypothetical protein